METGRGMFYESDESIVIKQNEQLICEQAYQIHNGLLYHYTGCETFWKIIDSDSFFARNIRFSNDSNEYMSGRDTIEKFIQELDELNQRQKYMISKQIKENPMMYFMVCFCGKGDLLSQWRGYAQTGVSMGLDFTAGVSSVDDIRRHIEWFVVLNNQGYQKELGGKQEDKYYIEDKDGDKTAVKFLQMPYKVQYASTGGQRVQKGVQKVLKELWEKSEPEERINNLIKYIPFIKNSSFCEEEEYRLVFDMEYLGRNKAYSRKVRSKKMEYIDVGGMKKPYVNVEFGQPENKLEKVCCVEFGSNVIAIAAQMQTDKALEDDVEIVLNDNRKDIYIGEGKNQEDVMEQIEKYIEQYSIQRHFRQYPKIWCEGHLPIREIVVGPGEQQREMKESLEFYKNTLYWLRYVNVKLSSIPLRS